MIDLIMEALAAHAFNTGGEAELQEAIARVLDDAGIPATREVLLEGVGRIDLVAGRGRDRVGIEVKIDGSLSALTRQLHRYAQFEDLSAFIVATTRHRLTRLPESLNGKPVRVAFVGRSL